MDDPSMCTQLLVGWKINLNQTDHGDGCDKNASTKKKE